jgi:hypothetical protein
MQSKMCRRCDSDPILKCKLGLPNVTLILIEKSQGPSVYGKHFFVGCSHWSREQRWDHIYWEVPPNISFSEHNILVGKRQRTQSTRAADAAESRPTKKGLR